METSAPTAWVSIAVCEFLLPFVYVSVWKKAVSVYTRHQKAISCCSEFNVFSNLLFIWVLFAENTWKALVWECREAQTKCWSHASLFTCQWPSQWAGSRGAVSLYCTASNQVSNAAHAPSSCIVRVIEETYKSSLFWYLDPRCCSHAALWFRDLKKQRGEKEWEREFALGDKQQCKARGLTEKKKGRREAAIATRESGNVQGFGELVGRGGST